MNRDVDPVSPMEGMGGARGHQDEALENSFRPFDPDQEEDEQVMEENARAEVAMKVKRAPEQPSRKEYEEHMATHWPFRDWCDHCVRGKAKGLSHRTGK